MEREKDTKINKYIVLLLITGAVYFFLRFISPLATPVIIAGMFLTLCYPTFDDIQKKTHIKKQYLASAILVLICACLIVLLWLGGSYLLQKIPVWMADTDNIQQEMEVFVGRCCQGVGDLFGIETKGFERIVVEQVDFFIENFEVQVLPEMLGGSWVYIRKLAGAIAVLAVTMIATVLLAKDYDSILSWMGAHAESRAVLEIFLQVIRYIATFVKAQFLIMFTIAVSCVLILFFSGVDHAVFFGILAGILDALPFIGTGIVLMPLAAWQLFSGKYKCAVFCVIAYILCVLIREFMEPKLIGRRVGVYPVAILVAVYAGLKLFGLWGIIKGPIGLVMIMHVYEAYRRYVDAPSQMHYDEEDGNAKEEEKAELDETVR